MLALLVSGIEWEGEGEEFVPTSSLSAHLGVPEDAISSITLLKRSLDARQRRPRWVANFRVILEGAKVESDVLARGVAGVRAWTERDEARHGFARFTEPKRVSWPRRVRPVVVGAGPAGLFAALRLAESGASVLLLERGQPVKPRIRHVNHFWRARTLDPEDNAVYGEGGAGTFSDGKIYTRRRDGLLGYIFRRLVTFGADEERLRLGWAHLGTDRVRKILPVFRARLQELGVEVRFGARVTGFRVEGGCCVGVELADGSHVERAPVIVAAGHSARDTMQALVSAGAAAETRPIAIGARIEHPQALIDRSRYRRDRGNLPPASYRLTDPMEGGRGVHTFCMCPGGIVVPATNHAGRVVVNGMSFASRRAHWSNSAIIVEVQPDEYPGRDPLAGLRFQDAIEARAHELGGGTFAAPGQRVVDLLAGRGSTEVPRSSYSHGVVPTDLRECLPVPIVEGMIRALRRWNEKIPGFAGEEALLIAPETRTTSPLRFLRRENLHSTTVSELLPVGEGAGYAGGIISAALDGVRAAESLVASHGTGVPVD